MFFRGVREKRIPNLRQRAAVILMAGSAVEKGTADLGVARRGKMDEVSRRPRKRFAVQLSTGSKDVGKAKSAIMFATIAQCSGCDAVVFCVQDGADALIKGKIKEEGEIPPGVPTFEQRVEDALKVGVKFQLCEQVAINRSLMKEDLIDGTEIVDGSHLITYALEYDGMLYF